MKKIQINTLMKVPLILLTDIFRFGEVMRAGERYINTQEKSGQSLAT